MVLRLYRNFRLLWLGQVVSEVGDGMQRIALLWWAKHAGGNGLLTLVAACTMVPTILCSPLGGWAADRFDRRALMAGADIARIATTATLAGLLLAGSAPTALVCALVVLTAVGGTVFDPAYAATVPTLVPEEHRPAANGLNIANSAVGGLLGPLVGGALISLFSVGTVMIVNAATFTWSAWFVLRTVLPKVRPAAAHADPTADGTEPAATGGARDGLRIVAGNSTIRRLVGVASVLNLVVAPVPLLIVTLAVDRFDLGASAYTLLAVMLSAGMLLGSVLAGRLARVTMATSMAAVGVSLAVAGWAPIGGVGVALVLAGVAIATVNTALLTTFQREIPADVLGRVFGVMGSLGEGLRPLGLLAAAPLLSGLGVGGAFLVVGGGVLATSVTWARPRRRRADDRRRSPMVAATAPTA